MNSIFNRFLLSNQFKFKQIVNHKRLIYLIFIISFFFFLNFRITADEIKLRSPDYSNINDWLVLPSKKTLASEIPENANWKDEQSKAEVDVFYIYPTTYLIGKNWNASLDDEELNHRTEERVVKRHLSIFVKHSKVYSPLYRQAIIKSFFKPKDKNSEAALKIAYEDIKQSFKYYIENYNQNRPWILVSHSQGTYHAIKLLNDFQNSKIIDRMIVGYLIGFPISKNEISLNICEKSNEINCIVNWNTYEKGSIPDKFFRSKISEICVNPLSFDANDVYMPKEKNLGSLGVEHKLINNLTGAECKNGYLYIDKIGDINFQSPRKGNYHIFDIGLFYTNIHNNLDGRIKSYFLKKEVK
jgi:hypothetical protein